MTIFTQFLHNYNKKNKSGLSNQKCSCKLCRIHEDNHDLMSNWSIIKPEFFFDLIWITKSKTILSPDCLILWWGRANVKGRLDGTFSCYNSHFCRRRCCCYGNRHSTWLGRCWTWGRGTNAQATAARFLLLLNRAWPRTTAVAPTMTQKHKDMI